jgi:hypothetical protein
VGIAVAGVLVSGVCTQAFTTQTTRCPLVRDRVQKRCMGVVKMGALPPDDSPYAKPEEERPFWGPDYVPRVGHPGTMPPGTRKEDKPIEELSKVSRIPWPHFQEWPWHYRSVGGMPLMARRGD